MIQYVQNLIHEIRGNSPGRAYRHHNMGVVEVENITTSMDIPNLEGYFNLSEKNSRRYKELGKIEYKRHAITLNEELLKEIALDMLFKKYTINEIEDMLLDYYGGNQK